jgi:hypothetical protein
VWADGGSLHTCCWTKLHSSIPPTGQEGPLSHDRWLCLQQTAIKEDASWECMKRRILGCTDNAEVMKIEWNYSNVRNKV